VLLTQGRLAERLPEHPGQALDLDCLDWQALAQEKPPERAISPEKPGVRDLHIGFSGPAKGSPCRTGPW
jgi:hypothetical protein